MRLFPVSIVMVQKTLAHVLSAMSEQSETESKRQRGRERQRETETDRQTDRETESYVFICLIVLLHYKDFCDFNNFIKRFNTIRDRSIREKSISHDFSCNSVFNLICQKFSISTVTSL